MEKVRLSFDRDAASSLTHLWDYEVFLDRRRAQLDLNVVLKPKPHFDIH